MVTLAPRLALATFALAFAPACGGGGGGSGSEGETSLTSLAAGSSTGSTEGPTTSGSQGETRTSSTGSGSGGSGGGGIKLDVGSPDLSVDPEAGCKKVDILYVIDNSPSMYDEQQTLIANFGAFVAEMTAALEKVSDYHVGVVTTDNYADEGFLDDSTLVVNASEPLCKILGGMVVESQQGVCTPFAEGYRFITEQDDLAAKFACVADVGEDGDSDERVGDALIGALSPLSNAPGQCNEGFLRPDALLIIVILTDENDSSNTDAGDWYDAVLASKKAAENVVVLSLIWDDSEASCQQDLSESTGYTIAEFTEMFPNHAVGNICDSSYDGFFALAVPTIDSACDKLIPT